jgi:molybdenum-dependent DNA-binding transcriptional regulator ModE
MQKKRALELLGGSVASAAKEVGISYQAVRKWPDPLPQRIADRVEAALARRRRASKKAA